jgi:hypothetical protein
MSAKVVKIVHMRIMACISEGVLDTPSIFLGKFGHVNEWRDCFFEFRIRNLSPSPLIISAKPEVDEEIAIDSAKTRDGSSMIVVDPLATRTVQGRLIASQFKRYPPALFQRNVQLRNPNNPSNSMTLVIIAKLTCRIWRTANLGTLNDDEQQSNIILPMVELPVRRDNPPCDKVFTIINTSDELVPGNFEILTDNTVEGFLRLELLELLSSV